MKTDKWSEKTRKNCQGIVLFRDCFELVFSIAMAHHELLLYFAPLTATLPEINFDCIFYVGKSDPHNDMDGNWCETNQMFVQLLINYGRICEYKKYMNERCFYSI